MFITKTFNKLESIDYKNDYPVANIDYLTDINFDYFADKYELKGKLTIIDLDYFSKYQQPYLVQIGNKFVGKLLLSDIDTQTDFTFVEVFRLIEDLGQVVDATVDSSIVVKITEVDVNTYVYPLDNVVEIPSMLNVFDTYKYVDIEAVEKMSEYFANDIKDATAYFFLDESDNKLKFRFVLPILDDKGELKPDRWKLFGKRLNILFFSKPLLETLGIKLKEFNGLNIVDVESLKNTFLNIQPPHLSYTISQDDFTTQPFEFTIEVSINKDTELEIEDSKDDSRSIPVAVISIEEKLFETSYLNTETYRFVIEELKV